VDHANMEYDHDNLDWSHLLVRILLGLTAS